MSPSEKIRALLDERGIEWWSVDSLDKVPLTICVIDGVRYKFRPQGRGIIVSSCTEGTVTPEQAIAATVGNGTDLASRLREVTGLHAFAELFGFDWEDESDWDWHDVACAMADVIDATAGGYGITFAPTLDRPPETMVGETVYDSEGNAIGWIANAPAEPDEATMLKLHSRMNDVLLDMNEEMLAYHSHDRENASSKKLIDCVIAAHQIIEDAAKAGARIEEVGA